MIFKGFRYFLGISFVIGGMVSTLLAQEALPKITAKSALLIDAHNGKVLFEKNADEQRQVASTQKLLTALLIAEAGNLDEWVSIAQSDTLVEPTKLYLKAGDAYRRGDLLRALLIKSPNDVAVALARDNAGSVEEFADKMNRRIFVLGASHSHFVNPNGLPDDRQYSTARDMAYVAQAVYEIPVLRNIINLKSLDFHYADGRVVTFQNTNRVLRENDFCNGMKTGYTIKAGHCLISSGVYEEKEVIAIVYGTTKARIWRESENLLRYGLGLPLKPEPKPSASSSRSKRKSSTKRR